MATGRYLKDLGIRNIFNPPAGAYRTKDNKHIPIAALGENNLVIFGKCRRVSHIILDERLKRDPMGKQFRIAGNPFNIDAEYLHLRLPPHFIEEHINEILW